MTDNVNKLYPTNAPKMKLSFADVYHLEKDGMAYYVFKPTQPISHFVDHYMVAEGYPTFIAERLFPNNEVELFFNLGSINSCKFYGGNANFEFKKTIISGLRSTFLEIFPGEYFHIAGMRFSLFGFYHLFQIPADCLMNENIPADEVLGKVLNELREQLGEQHSPIAMAQLMDAWVRRKVHAYQVARSWLRVDDFLKNPRMQIKKNLPELFGYTYKHSAHLIQKMCGLHPKLVQRIYRLNSLFSCHPEYTQYGWSALASEFGYTDQSHFIKELKLFTGYTPSELINAQPKDFLLKTLR